MPGPMQVGSNVMETGQQEGHCEEERPCWAGEEAMGRKDQNKSIKFQSSFLNVCFLNDAASKLSWEVPLIGPSAMVCMHHLAGVAVVVRLHHAPFNASLCLLVSVQKRHRFTLRACVAKTS